MQPLFAHYYLDDRDYTITLTDCLDYASYENVADELYIGKASFGSFDWGSEVSAEVLYALT